jgi:hypothetical protein
MKCPICDSELGCDAIVLTEVPKPVVSVMTNAHMVPATRWDCVNGHTILVVNKLRLDAATHTDADQVRMQRLFKRVADKNNWKNPINCFVPILTEAEKTAMSAAITHFTGSSAEFHDDKRKKTTHVTAAGYYEAIGS